MNNIKSKKVLFVLLVLFISRSASSQQLTAELSNYRGVNVSCSGSTDGMVNLILPVNPGLCTYRWSTGATTEDLNNLGAGNYSVTVTTAGGTVLYGSWTLTAPKGIDAIASLSNYHGFNISMYGGSDGEIFLEPTGGVAPYKIVWSTGKVGARISQLPVGSYTSTITDANGCAAIKTYTLTEPSPLQFNSVNVSSFNGYQVSCKKARDGFIEIGIAGGIPPYVYSWSNGGMSDRVEELCAGEYMLQVSDGGHSTIDTVIVLSEPPQIEVTVSASNYPNGKSISCYDCFNGYIKLSANSVHGVLQYAWSTGAVTDSVFNLGSGVYSYVVRDGYQCEVTGEYELTQPERDDWQIQGNRQVDPAVQFLGTLDSSSLVFKSNSTERMRIGGAGEIKINEFASSGDGYVIADSNGVLRKISTPVLVAPNWRTNGNIVTTGEFLGSINAEDLIFKTNNTIRSKFSADGTFSVVGKANFSTTTLDPEKYFQIKPDQTQFPLVNTIMSIDPALIPVAEHGLVLHTSTSNPFYFPFAVFKPDLTTTCFQGEYVFRIDNDGFVQAKDIRVFPNGWCDYVFDKEYALMPLSERKKWIVEHHHLPGMPDEKEVEKEGVSVEQMLRLQLKQIEELNLYVIQLEAKISALEESLRK